jgi:uncharacterized protein YdeI (YjbR/CyaY-like superfamily)
MPFDKRVDAYITGSQPFARPILTHIRRLVHKGCPDVVETIKWGFPHFDYKGMMCSMAAFKAHCAMGFWKASLLPDALKLQTKNRDAMGNFGRITSLKELPPDKTLITWIRGAAKLNDEGIVVARKAKPEAKPALRPPAYLVAALRKNPAAQKTFREFTPGHKREYLVWITEAKTEGTRQRRLETAIAWLAEGKRLNWKYERKK